jgi:hypothetical protein
MTSTVKELLVSCDSHVHFTDDWVKDRLPSRLKPRWDEASLKTADYEGTELRKGLPGLAIEDFVDTDPASDPGHFEPHAKLKAAYDYFGLDCLYWSTDFPHPATCWPNSQKQVKEQFAAAGIPEADRRKIVYENGVRTFGLNS